MRVPRALKVLQALILVCLGVVLMVSLPTIYFGTSFLTTVIGLFLFLYAKLLFYASPKKPGARGK